MSLVYCAISTVPAGTSATNPRIDTDRDRECSNGERVGFTRFHLQMEPSGTATGSIEYMIFKVERAFTVPVVGTDPIPSSAEVDTQGIQQAFRLNMSTWCCKFGTIALSPDTPVSRTITINWAKFKKATVKDGDHYGIAMFNRTSGTVNWSVQMFYKSYR